MIHRFLGDKIQQWAEQYPVITITGPRQSGKTTLSKAVFPDKPYVSLEDFDHRDFARRDPRGFLARHPEGMIIDEIQNAPELVSYIQTDVDSVEQPGRFILTGSRQFEMMTSVSQSLAGRTAIARLMPFSLGELFLTRPERSLDDILFTGFYPRIHDQNLAPSEALSFYVSTYLERDVRQLLNVKDLSRFEAFLKLCAGRTGQLLNHQSLANDTGVGANTIKSWLSVLEASGIILLLPPWFANIGKRLVKSPKLIFLDSGLACFLLGLRSPEHLRGHPLRGHIFESFVIADALKQRYHRGLDAPFYFYRDNNGCEVDLVHERGPTLEATEIKAAMTVSNDFFKNLKKIAKYTDQVEVSRLIHGGDDEPYTRERVQCISWRDLADKFTP